MLSRDVGPDRGRHRGPALDGAGARDADRSAIARFTGLVAALCVERGRDIDGADAIIAAFHGIPEPLARALAQQVADFLFKRAIETGDWSTWANALHHLQGATRRASGAPPLTFARPLAAAVSHEPSPRQLLSRLCFRLMERGTPSKSLVRQVEEFNRMLTAPLAARDLNALVIWCAGRRRADAR